MARLKTGEKKIDFEAAAVTTSISTITDWKTDFAFECLGVRIRVCADQELPDEIVSELLPPYSQKIVSKNVAQIFSLKINRDESVLFENSKEKLRFPGDDWVLEALRGQLKTFISQNSNQYVFIHAGAIAWRDQLILIPGFGFSGKTTLTAELVRAGAVYYSDDLAVVDPDGLVYPYPKPLSMRQRDSFDGAQIDLAVGHFGGIQGVRPLPVKLVVITRYQRRAAWRPQVLTPGAGVLEMLKHTNNSLNEPELAVRVLQKIALQAKIIKTKRGDAQKAARVILQEVLRKK